MLEAIAALQALLIVNKKAKRKQAPWRHGLPRMELPWLCLKHPLNTSGINWNTKCTPALLIWHQYLNSLMKWLVSECSQILPNTFHNLVENLRRRLEVIITSKCGLYLEQGIQQKWVWWLHVLHTSNVARFILSISVQDRGF